ncbi:transporter substrate-binding domain-containing protein [Vibrio cyclitrophicus]
MYFFKIKNLLGLSVLALSTAVVAGNNIVKIGTDATYPPYEYQTSNGEIVGFEIEIGNAICEVMQKQCEWQNVGFDGLILGLKSRKVDIAFSSLGITESRKQHVSFSDVIWTGYSSMLSHRDLHLEPTAESLKGKTVGVQIGTMQEDYANQVLAQNGVNVKVYQDQDSVYLDLKNGRIDASLQDMVQAQFTFIRDGKNADYVNTKIVDALLPADSAVAVRKNDKNTLAWFNEGLNKIHQNGNFEKIQTKYFGQLVLAPAKEY